jgi:hypothetical protein
MDVIFQDCTTKGCDSVYTWNLLMTRALKPWFSNPEMTDDVLRVLEFMKTGKGLDGDRESVSKVTVTTVTDMCTVVENRRAMKTTLSLRRTTKGSSKGFDKAAYDQALLSIDFGKYDLPWKNAGGASCPSWVKLISGLFPTEADIDAGIVPKEAVERALQAADETSDEIRIRAVADADLADVEDFLGDDQSGDENPDGGAAAGAGAGAGAGATAGTSRSFNVTIFSLFNSN